MLSELSIGNHKLYISTTKHKHKRRRPTILEIYLNIIGTVFPIYFEEKLKKKKYGKKGKALMVYKNTITILINN